MMESKQEFPFRQDERNVLRPLTREEVIARVKWARVQRQSLYPVSTGLNWGYGSASPVSPDSLLMDLSGMNRILNADAISVANPVAVIEPGVTQGQLHDFLQKHCPSLMFNVTGAGRDTSILGSSLDRGVGYLGPRREDLFGLEVVTGTGQVLCTGFRRLGEGSRLAHTHPYGLGPMLDGLFFQGNFGIVTSACFKLVHRAPCQLAVSVSPRRESDLPALIDELALLKRRGLMSSVTHIGNKARTHSSLMYGVSSYLESLCGLAPEALAAEASKALNQVAPHEWTSLGGVSGTWAQVAAAVYEIRRRLRHLAQVRVLSDGMLSLGYGLMHRLRYFSLARANAAAIAAMKPLHGLASGIPTDVAIDNLLWKFGRPDLPARRLDESRCGVLFISPALPMDGRFAVEVVQEMVLIARQHQHALYITLNIETATSLVAVTNLLFDRTDEQESARAHRCADALLAHVRAKGLEVYRARTDMMADMVRDDPNYWNTVRGLKAVFDPDNIVAPGRYNLI